MKRMAFWVLLAMIMGVSACNEPKETDTTQEEARVTAAFDGFIQTLEQGDQEGYYTYLTDDFVGYDPGRAPLKLDDQFRKDMASFFETTTFKLKNHQTQEVIVRDDIAVHRHTGTIVLGSRTNDSLSPLTLKVNYLDVMEKDASGDWKLKIHTVNVSQ